MIDLKNYVCLLPFTKLEIDEGSTFMCCPAWLKKRLPDNAPLEELWNCDDANDIRKSLVDGSFRYCDKQQCPYLNQLLTVGDGYLGPLLHKKNAPDNIKKNIEKQTGEMEDGCEMIQMSFDKTCNYQCPSCRVELIIADGENVKRVNSRIEEIENVFGKDLKWIYITGSGDPFVSVGFRNFLRNFNPKKFPKLTNIHLHTNASKWNKTMWNSMKSIWPYVKTCEISIDAATKETYENNVRIGGNWENLMENLKFINTIRTLPYIKTSFVVQDSNYREMKQFLDLMKQLFGKKAHVYFSKITNWGTFTDGEFKLKQIWDENHPEHNNFLKELDKIWKDPQVFHNMQEFIKINKELI